MRQGHPVEATLERIKALFGPWRSTISRWRQYFQELFIESKPWKRLRGCLMPPIEAQELPRGLLQRFFQGAPDPLSAMVNCLEALALGP